MSNFKNEIIKNEKGIWAYTNFYNEFIEEENRLRLNTKKSIFENIGAKFIQNVYFKREDKNVAGSLKDRSLAYQVSLAKQNQNRELVISTSGNAGIAAAAYCKEAGIKLYIFISPKTEKAKIVEMQKYNPIIIESRKSIRFANYLSVKYKIENLRPSANDTSIEGYKSLAFEIFEEFGKIDAIFTFVTSGSSFVGIGRAYKYLLENNEIKKMPKLFAVQGGSISSIAEEFEKITKVENSSVGKLGVKNTRRKNEVIEYIKSSGGKGIYIKDKELQEAKKILAKNKIYTSQEGCASFAASIRNRGKYNFDKVVCILSGKLRAVVDQIDESKIYEADCFEKIDKIISSVKLNYKCKNNNQ